MRGAPSVALQNPFSFKFREHALQVGNAKIAEFGIAHLIEVIALWQVFGQIHDMAAAIGAGRFEIGVFDHAHKGETWVIDIEPIGAR